MPTNTVSLEVENISKTFASTTVLSSLTATLHAGEIVALVGENGSGKSTFIKVLSGFHEPDRDAVVRMGGIDITSDLTDGPEKTGLGFIHQDLALVGNLSIIENLRIGRFDTGLFGRIRWRSEAELVRTMIARVGLDVDPRTLIDDLSVTDRALVAIARGLSEIERASDLDARVLVLDEPTAYLPADGVVRLFAAVKLLADQGVSVIFVSHRLDEVLDHCSRVLVLRGGVLVADEPTSGKSERDLITLMLGRAPEDLYPTYSVTPGDTVLEVTGLRGDLVSDLSFSGRAGEIVGFVGLPGSGYEEIPYLLAGTTTARAGQVTITGNTITAAQLMPERAIAAGMVLLPADRKGASGAIALSVADNVTIATLGTIVRFGTVLSHRAQSEIVAEQIERFGIALPSQDSALATLSGGNQQKALLAKWVIADPAILVLHEPTQGVDVGAKRDVFRHLTDLAHSGTLLLVASVEYEDLAQLCTRVHVVRAGTIVRTIERDDLTAHELAAAVHQR